MQFPACSWTLVVASCFGPCGAWGRSRISPPRFLVECRKRRLNQGSFVSAVCLVVCFRWFVLCLCVYFCDLYWVFSLFFVCQVIGCEDRLWNDLCCVGWGIKLYSIQSDASCFSLTECKVFCVCHICLVYLNVYIYNLLVDSLSVCRQSHESKN